MKKIVLASNNPGKVREIQAILAEHDFHVIPQAELGTPDTEETGLTFVENAILKARHAAHHSGLPAIADDSGLEVDALGGAPGVYSARYAGFGASDAENNARLLEALAGIPRARRSARFRCVMVFLRHAGDPSPVMAEGAWPGLILEEARGAAGFGYDPLFYVPECGCASAELAPDEKNRLSHRGQALRTLVAALAAASHP
jgi:XTP/dITP diphosphohydrolase